MAHTIGIENETLMLIVQSNLNWFGKWRATEAHILYYIQRHHFI